MTLTKKDWELVAVMIAHAVMTTAAATVTADAAAAAVDSEAVETVALEPETKVMSGVKMISIHTELKGVAGVLQPGAGISNLVKIKGRVNGQVTHKFFGFPPGDEAHLSELKRIQNYPHLFQNVYFTFREPASGDRYITRLFVWFDATL
ncbi:MAG: hypothetical protein O6949_09395 [Chloroflexi bacterium]|nr:hypothetical protein [Chloroflexota bacterium]